VFDGCADVDVLVSSLVAVDVDEVVMNSARSFCWKATLIGCPHIKIGPTTAVEFRPESAMPERAATVVVP